MVSPADAAVTAAPIDEEQPPVPPGLTQCVAAAAGRPAPVSKSPPIPIAVARARAVPFRANHEQLNDPRIWCMFPLLLCPSAALIGREEAPRCVWSRTRPKVQMVPIVSRQQEADMLFASINVSFCTTSRFSTAVVSAGWPIYPV